MKCNEFSLCVDKSIHWNIKVQNVSLANEAESIYRKTCHLIMLCKWKQAEYFPCADEMRSCVKRCEQYPALLNRFWREHNIFEAPYIHLYIHTDAIKQKWSVEKNNEFTIFDGNKTRCWYFHVRYWPHFVLFLVFNKSILKMLTLVVVFAPFLLDSVQHGACTSITTALLILVAGYEGSAAGFVFI